MNTAGLGLAGLRHKNSRCGGPSDKQRRLAKEEASVLYWIISKLPSVIYVDFLSFCFCTSPAPSSFLIYFPPPHFVCAFAFAMSSRSSNPLIYIPILSPSFCATLCSSSYFLSLPLPIHIKNFPLFSFPSLHMYIIGSINQKLKIKLVNLMFFLSTLLYINYIIQSNLKLKM